MSVTNEHQQHEGREGGVPLIVFIPIVLCFISILILLDYRQRRDAQERFIQQEDERAALEEIMRLQEQQQQQTAEDDNDENDVGEGSSTGVVHRVKKVGKKRGEKLRRKEEMRRYREYMDHQREIQRQQAQLLQEQERIRKSEQVRQRDNELNKLRKQREKQAKAEAKEAAKKQKQEEKERKNREYKYKKYAGGLKKLVKEKKLSTMSELAKTMRIAEEDVMDILKQLCNMDEEFSLSLWAPGNREFLFVTEDDYVQFEKELRDKKGGRISIHEGDLSMLCHSS